MKMSCGHIIAKALRDENIRYGFGIPGTHNIELYDALSEDESFTSVLVTDEQCASFMVDGFARASGKMAMVNVVPGAGLTHAMSGIAEAYMDQVPMLVLTCGIRQDTGNAYQLHDVDQVAMATPVCKKTYRIKTHRELYPSLREACSLARQAPAGPVLVEVPANLYLFPGDVVESDLTWKNPQASLDEIDSGKVTEIVKLLGQSQAIVIYVGAGAVNCGNQLVELADRLDAVVFTSLSGKGVFPENHARWGWNTMGPAAPKGLREFGDRADCVLAVGCRFGEVATASFGFKLPENLIHIDADESVFNRNYPAKITLKAEAHVALNSLLAHLDLHAKKSDTKKWGQLKRAHDEVTRDQLSYISSEGRVAPQQLLMALQKDFGPNTVFVTDSGNGTFLAMEHLRLTEPRSFLGPMDYSCMGYSVPAAIGAKIACPERPVIALAGDGAFLMTGMELVTAVHGGVGVVVLILRDGELSQIAQFQRISLNRQTLTTLPPLDFQSFAKAVGADYLSIACDADIASVVAKAKEIASQNKPILLEVRIDYSQKTYFTSGVVKTNFLRFPWKDRLRLAGRVIKRKFF